MKAPEDLDFRLQPHAPPFLFKKRMVPKGTKIKVKYKINGDKEDYCTIQAKLAEPIKSEFEDDYLENYSYIKVISKDEYDNIWKLK